jgi:hypothetical protein
MHNKRNKRNNKQGNTITEEFTKDQSVGVINTFENITNTFETIYQKYPLSLNVTMYLNFWGGQLMENDGIDNKKIIVNDITIFLSGFDVIKKLRKLAH